MGVGPSLGTFGHAYSNAMAVSLLVSLECEFIDQRSVKTRTEVMPSVNYEGDQLANHC